MARPALDTEKRTVPGLRLARGVCMTEVTLHFRADRLHKTCAVCKADFARHGQTDRWWLRNTWTDRRDDYHEGEGCWPGDWMVPCGRLPDDSKTPNARANARP